MRPTIEEQLDGARRLLARVEDGGTSAAETRALLGHVGRLLGWVRASWAARLPFLLEDNGKLAGLLRLPPPAAGTDVAAAEELNTELRGKLARLIRELPATDEGLARRHEIARYLRDRAIAEPA